MLDYDLYEKHKKLHLRNRVSFQKDDVKAFSRNNYGDFLEKIVDIINACENCFYVKRNLNYYSNDNSMDKNPLYSKYNYVYLIFHDFIVIVKDYFECNTICLISNSNKHIVYSFSHYNIFRTKTSFMHEQENKKLDIFRFDVFSEKTSKSAVHFYLKNINLFT